MVTQWSTVVQTCRTIILYNCVWGQGRKKTGHTTQTALDLVPVDTLKLKNGK